MRVLLSYSVAVFYKYGLLQWALAFTSIDIGQIYSVGPHICMWKYCGPKSSRSRYRPNWSGPYLFWYIIAIRNV